MSGTYIRLLVLLLVFTALLLAQTFRNNLISANTRAGSVGGDGVLLSSVTDSGKGNAAKKSGLSVVPPIDTRSYENVQTATFALG